MPFARAARTSSMPSEVLTWTTCSRHPVSAAKAIARLIAVVSATGGRESR